MSRSPEFRYQIGAARIALAVLAGTGGAAGEQIVHNSLGNTSMAEAFGFNPAQCSSDIVLTVIESKGNHVLGDRVRGAKVQFKFNEINLGEVLVTDNNGIVKTKVAGECNSYGGHGLRIGTETQINGNKIATIFDFDDGSGNLLLEVDSRLLAVSQKTESSAQQSIPTSAPKPPAATETPTRTPEPTMTTIATSTPTHIPTSTLTPVPVEITPERTITSISSSDSDRDSDLKDYILASLLAVGVGFIASRLYRRWRNKNTSTYNPPS